MEHEEAREPVPHALRAVSFDLGDTLVEWPDRDEAAPARWSAAFDAARRANPAWRQEWRPEFVAAMRAAELAHWKRVERLHASDRPEALVRDGFRRLGRACDDAEVMAVLDGYAAAVAGWAEVFPDARATLSELRARGYRLGLLSNTWWAAAWHNADLASHGIDDLLDVVAYTSDLPWSKPHPLTFATVAQRLDVAREACVMVGDRPVDDVEGAQLAGMRAVWKTNDRPRPRPNRITPSATIAHLAELPARLRSWGGR